MFGRSLAWLKNSAPSDEDIGRCHERQSVPLRHLFAYSRGCEDRRQKTIRERLNGPFEDNHRRAFLIRSRCCCRAASPFWRPTWSSAAGQSAAGRISATAKPPIHPLCSHLMRCVTADPPARRQGQSPTRVQAALIAEELDVRTDQFSGRSGRLAGYWKPALATRLRNSRAAVMEWQSGAMAPSSAIMKLIPGIADHRRVDGTVPDGFVQAGQPAPWRENPQLAASTEIRRCSWRAENQKQAKAAADGTSLSYAELAQLAADIEPPQDIETTARI